jgi:hypothetical protein
MNSLEKHIRTLSTKKLLTAMIFIGYAGTARIIDFDQWFKIDQLISTELKARIKRSHK